MFVFLYDEKLLRRLEEELSWNQLPWCSIAHQVKNVDTIALDLVENSLSHEWPVVLAVFKWSQSPVLYSYQHKLAMSRAISKLHIIEIIYQKCEANV